MGKVKYSPKAAAKIRTTCEFYKQFDSELPSRARLTIVSSLGRPWLLNLNYRERVIPFGSSHFLALYQFDETSGDILVLGIRHEREMSYGLEDDT
jgi:ParE toxin of type II toxin-antitoxin system, parDE